MDEESPYFTQDEIDTMIKWANQAIRLQEGERSRHYRNTDKDNAIAEKAAKRIEYYTILLGKIMELPIVAQPTS